MCKRMSEDVRAFSTIGELILRTSLFGPFSTPPHFLAAKLTGRGANGVESMVSDQEPWAKLWSLRSDDCSDSVPLRCARRDSFTWQTMGASMSVFLNLFCDF